MAAEVRWGTRARDTPAGMSIEFGAESEMADLLLEQRQRFIAKFGRPPGPEDPIFFDPDVGSPQAVPPVNLETATVKAMYAAGLDPGYIYAYQQTGLILTEMNRHLLPDADIQEFEEAADRYHRLHPE